MEINSMFSTISTPGSQAAFFSTQKATKSASQTASQVNANAESDAFQKEMQKEIEQSLLNSKLIANSSQQKSGTPAAKVNASKSFADEVIEDIKSGKSFSEAMLDSKAEAFKMLFAEELEKNGGDAQKAIVDAKTKLQMDLTDEELLGIVQELAQENSGNEQVHKDLLAFADKLKEKIALDDVTDTDKADNINKAFNTNKSPILEDNSILNSKSTVLNSKNIEAAQSSQYIDSAHKTYEKNQNSFTQSRNETNPLHLVT